MLHNNVYWNDAPWSAFETLQHNESCDVCVIGLGGSGLHAIEYFVAHGFDVVGIDAGMVGGGAAGSNGGLILAGIAAFHHDAVSELGHHIATSLYHETLAEMDMLAQHEPSLHRGGSLRIAADEAEYGDCLAQYDCMRSDGLSVELYDGPEGKGLLFPHDGTFQPLQRVRRMAVQARAAGARLYERTVATGVATGMVQTPHHVIKARRILVAVDGNLERVFPQLNTKVRTTRLQMVATAPDDKLILTRPVYYRYGYDYWQQRPDKSIVIGGSRDRHAASEWGHVGNPTAQVQESIEQTLRTVVGSHAPVTHRWGACVGYRLDDVRPIVTSVMPDVWACGAYNGTGNLVGAICARHVARAMHTGDYTPLRHWLTQ